MIEVKKKKAGDFQVIVDEGDSRTEHNVKLNDEYYQKLTGGKITEEELIKRSFDFLLQRESKESILSKFNLELINRYFPEYEREIKKL